MQDVTHDSKFKWCAWPQMHTELKNSKRLKDLYHRALTIKSAIPHPRILGVIRECGGKMHMHERSWSEAATDFFEVPFASRFTQLLCFQGRSEPLISKPTKQGTSLSF